jgi:hypothetical protein
VKFSTDFLVLNFLLVDTACRGSDLLPVLLSILLWYSMLMTLICISVPRMTVLPVSVQQPARCSICVMEGS